MGRRLASGCLGALTLGFLGCGTGSVPLEGVQGTTSAADKRQERFSVCFTSPADSGSSLRPQDAVEEFGLESASVVNPGSSIPDIDRFLETCPQNDPATATILNDLTIRRDGTPVTSFPCSEPVSAMPLSQYTDELIVLQGLRVMYYMDQGRSGHLPWTAGTMYDWMKSRIGGINLVAAGPSCCGTIDGQRYINIPLSNDFNRDFDRKWEGISGNIALYGHETRHLDGFPHDSCCGVSNGCDQTYDESNLSPYGIQWWLNQAWLTGSIDVGFACLDAGRIRDISNWHLSACNNTFAPRFCETQPPWLEMPAYPGSTSSSGPACASGCLDDADCDDGLACNGRETCSDSLCLSGTPITCGDGVSCTVDRCTEPAGACTYSPSDVFCDDNDGCTVDTCDALLGCQSESVVPCCGNQICEPSESCDVCPDDCPSGGHAVCGNGVCEAGEDCTDESCPLDCRGQQTGKPDMRFCCSGTTSGGGGVGPTDCSDPACTSDGWACDSAALGSFCCGDGACMAGEDGTNCAVDCVCAVDADCDDGDGCTIDQCVAGLCARVARNCDDGDACTIDRCESTSGCVYVPSASCGCVAGGDSCSADSDCCSGKCRNGVCRGN